MKTIIVIMILLMPSIVDAQSLYERVFVNEPWDIADRILGGTLAGLKYIDYRQTNVVFKNPHRYKEVNGVIRWFYNKWDDEGVLLYFGLSYGLSYLVLDNLKQEHRKIGLIILNSLQLSLVRNNYSIGIRITH